MTKKLKIYIFLLMGLQTMAWPLAAQNYVLANQKNGIICHVENNQLIFDIDVNQPLASLIEDAARFDIDTMVLRQAIQGIPAIVAGDAIWTSQRTTKNNLRLSKSMWGKKDNEPEAIILINDNWISNAINTINRSTSTYGINQFTHHAAFSYHDGLATFTLKGKKNADKVVLSGTFNNWSTMRPRMQKTPDGWTITIPLKPGEYEYKYIVDGRWTIDPANSAKQPNDAGTENSVVFAYNYRFFLTGYQKARRVTLAASFNGWNKSGPRMTQTENGWELNMWVKEGTHAYKFIVDGQWIQDPNATVNRPDGNGNINSFMSIGDTIMFNLKGFKTAKNVMLAGNFNAWNAAELQMTPTTNGWKLPYVLAPGNYEYKYIVDGKWMADPNNPFTNGSGEHENSILTVKPNYTFRLKGYPSAKTIVVSGSFNDWSTSQYKMKKKEDHWVLPVYLSPGKYTYKFIVDDQWILDPANKLWEENEFGNGNSVLWIEP